MSVASRYQTLVAEGAIEADPAQIAAVRQLDRLCEILPGYALASKRGALGWLFGSKSVARDTPRGLYIWGEVGRGKTMLMDLFFRELNVVAKRRVHFNAFMAEVHDRVFRIREAIKAGKLTADDPITPVAADIGRETRVLCFDEFSVTDIADAMILGRLFTQLFANGIVMIATSNIAPDDLYRGGLQRQNFLPFVALLREKVDVIKLESRTDFRLEKLEDQAVYYTPLGPDADTAMDQAWKRMTGGREHALTLTVKARSLLVPRASVRQVRFTFDELCRQPLGASDYIALAREFHTFLVDRIPVMTYAERNEAKRFITLIDTLYDHGAKLVASAAAEPPGLYVADEGKEAFEFQRTASRLIEMRSREYLAMPHAAPGQDSFVPIQT